MLHFDPPLSPEEKSLIACLAGMALLAGHVFGKVCGL